MKTCTKFVKFPHWKPSAIQRLLKEKKVRDNVSSKRSSLRHTALSTFTFGSSMIIPFSLSLPLLYQSFCFFFSKTQTTPTWGYLSMKCLTWSCPDCLIFGWDCLIFSQDCLIFIRDCLLFGQDYLLFGQDCLLFGRDCLIFCRDCLIFGWDSLLNHFGLP